jgi:hypothetical protein
MKVMRKNTKYLKLVNKKNNKNVYNKEPLFVKPIVRGFVIPILIDSQLFVVRIPLTIRLLS